MKMLMTKDGTVHLIEYTQDALGVIEDYCGREIADYTRAKIEELKDSYATLWGLLLSTVKQLSDYAEDSRRIYICLDNLAGKLEEIADGIEQETGFGI